jgi:hypothetical protein
MPSLRAVLLTALLAASHAFTAKQRHAAVTARQRHASKQEPTTTDRRSLLGLLVPLGVGAATQAPLIALIANPPDESTRTAMLESWCAADYCTLLGGGAGYSPGAGGFVGNYVPPDDDFARERDAILAEAARGSGS